MSSTDKTEGDDVKNMKRIISLFIILAFIISIFSTVPIASAQSSEPIFRLDFGDFSTYSSLDAKNKFTDSLDTYNGKTAWTTSLTRTVYLRNDGSSVTYPAGIDPSKTNYIVINWMIDNPDGVEITSSYNQLTFIWWSGDYHWGDKNYGVWFDNDRLKRMTTDYVTDIITLNPQDTSGTAESQFGWWAHSAFEQSKNIKLKIAEIAVFDNLDDAEGYNATEPQVKYGNYESEVDIHSRTLSFTVEDDLSADELKSIKFDLDSSFEKFGTPTFGGEGLYNTVSFTVREKRNTSNAWNVVFRSKDNYRPADNTYIRDLTDDFGNDCIMYDFSTFAGALNFINNGSYTMKGISKGNMCIRQVTYGGIALQFQGYGNTDFSITFGDMQDIKKNYGYVRACYDIQNYTPSDAPSTAKSSKAGIGVTSGNYAELYTIKFKSGSTTPELYLAGSGAKFETRGYYSSVAKLPSDVKTSSGGNLTFSFGTGLPYGSMCVNLKYLAFFKTQEAAQEFDETLINPKVYGEECEIDRVSHKLKATLAKELTEYEASTVKTDVLSCDLFNNEASSLKSYSNSYVKNQECAFKPNSKYFDISVSGDIVTMTADYTVTNMIGETNIWTLSIDAPYKKTNYELLDFSISENAQSLIDSGTVSKTKYDPTDRLWVKPINYGGPALEIQHSKYPQFLAKFNTADTKKEYWVKMLYCFERLALKDGQSSDPYLTVSWYEDANYASYKSEQYSMDSLPEAKKWREAVFKIAPSSNSLDVQNKQMRIMFAGLNANVLIKYIGLFENESDAKAYDISLSGVKSVDNFAYIQPFEHTALLNDGNLGDLEYTLYNSEAQTGEIENGYPESRVSVIFSDEYEYKDSILYKKLNLKTVDNKETVWKVGIPYKINRSLDTDGGLVNAKYENCPDGLKRIVALYNKDGTLKKVKSSDTGNVKIDGLDGTYTVKSFLWNNYSGIMPVDKVIEKYASFDDYGDYDVYNSRKKIWEAVPCVSAKQKSFGISGGEGGQVQTYITGSSDGSLLLTFADVGNVLKSTDGGKHWTECGANIRATGLTLGAVDPVNPKKVIGVTTNGTSNPNIFDKKNYTGKGIYVSEDGADTFTQTLIFNDNAMHRDRDAIAFDITSCYLDGIEGCARVYYSTQTETFEDKALTISKLEKSKGYNEGEGLYLSSDGGYTWKKVNSDMSHADLAVSPFDGRVFAVKNATLYKSDDFGKTFTKLTNTNLEDNIVYDVKTLDLDHDKYVYIIGKNGLSISKDNGNTFTYISGNYSNSRGGTTDFEVSTKNPLYMAYTEGNPVGETGAYSYRINVSHDGGKTWINSEYNQVYDFCRVQPRRNPLFFDPTDENVIYSGSDWPWKSTDGGISFRESANGVSAFCLNSWWQPNVYNSDIWLVPAQDYLGAVTLDNGETFTPLQDLNKGGVLHSHSYGGYAVNENVWFVCSDSNWEETTADLIITFDGGKTWENKGRIVESGYIYNRCGQSRRNPDILYAGDVRSTDGGRTWSKMDSRIRCIMDVSKDGSKMFALGKTNTHECYISYDDGATWSLYFTAPARTGSYGGIQYMLDYNDGDGYVYFASYGDIYKYKSSVLTKVKMPDAAKDIWWFSYAIDPNHPNVMYAAGTSSDASQFSTYNMDNSIFRTCDYGATWQVISTISDGDTIVKDGPVVGRHTVKCMFVNPKTGYVYVPMGNQGLYKFAPPYYVE